MGILQLPVPIVWLFDRIEVLAESGSTLVSRHEAFQLITPLRHLNDSQLQLLQRPLNYWTGWVYNEYGTLAATQRVPDHGAGRDPDFLKTVNRQRVGEQQNLRWRPPQ